MPSAREICNAIPDATCTGSGQDRGQSVVVDHVTSFRAADRRSLSWLRGGAQAHMWHGDVVITAHYQVLNRVLSSPFAVIRCDNPRLGLAYALQSYWPNTPCKPDVPSSVHVGSWSVIGQHGNSVEWDPGRQRYMRIPPQAGVVIKDHVWIGAHVTVVRGVLEDTFIDEGTEICNHVNVGHGVHVGKHCILAPFVAIGGSTVIGDRVTIWQHAVIRNGVTIGEGATIGQGANVLCDVPAGETWVGNPAHKLR